MVAWLVWHAAQVGLSPRCGTACLQSLRLEQPGLPSREDAMCDVPRELPSLWLRLRAVV